MDTLHAGGIVTGGLSVLVHRSSLGVLPAVYHRPASVLKGVIPAHNAATTSVLAGDFVLCHYKVQTYCIMHGSARL